MRKQLHTYIDDHLSGSVVALELLAYFSDSLPQEIATPPEVLALRDDIATDQKVLLDILHELGGRESVVKQMGAWMTEK
ncbi:MAG: hypothetical protein JWO08_1261, partial [Verrucomicrobiaceae bacterium]|nr:hypothetical protein [Verrucomicrobiaceae bacterium]